MLESGVSNSMADDDDQESVGYCFTALSSSHATYFVHNTMNLNPAPKPQSVTAEQPH